MPSLSAYTNVQLDDEHAIESWLLAHRMRHQTYAYAASKAGVSVGPYLFDDYPDDTWFANHTSAHQVLYQFMAPDQSVDMTVLTNVSWDDQQDFDTWMKMHTLIHQLLDQSLGLLG